jgi:hypothetical protein
MADLDAFLTKNVEGYLLGDLETLKAARPPAGRTDGAAGYPLLASAFAGIELLGGLGSPTKFNRSDGATYFERFWRGCLYPNHALRGNAGPVLYQLARHGLAHAFVVKGDLLVVKGAPGWHLVRTSSGAVSIDAVELADDLKEAYWKRFKPLLSQSGAVNRTTIAAQLDEMERQYHAQASPLLANLILPPAPYLPPGPVSSSFRPTPGVSGPAFNPYLTFHKSTP